MRFKAWVRSDGNAAATGTSGGTNQHGDEKKPYPHGDEKNTSCGTDPHGGEKKHNPHGDAENTSGGTDPHGGLADTATAMGSTTNKFRPRWTRDPPPLPFLAPQGSSAPAAQESSAPATSSARAATSSPQDLDEFLTLMNRMRTEHPELMQSFLELMQRFLELMQRNLS